MKNLNDQLKNMFVGSNYVIKTLYKSTPMFIIIFIIINALISFIPAFNIMLSKNVIDRLFEIYENEQSNGIWTYIILLFALTVLSSLLINSRIIVSRFMESKNEKYLTSLILSKISKIQIKHLEHGSSIDSINAAMNSRSYITSSFAAYIRIITSAISFISMISIIFTYYPTIAFFYLVTTIPALIVSNTYDRRMSMFEIDSIPETRKKNYYYYMLTSAEYAKDIRLYDLKEPFKNEYNSIWNIVLSQREKIFTEGFRKLNYMTIVQTFGYIGLYTYLIQKTYVGELSIGGLSAFTGAVIGISFHFNSFISESRLYQKLFIPRIFKILDFMGWDEENNTKFNSNVPKENFDITFSHVSFTYPWTNNKVLNDVSFTIKYGEKVSIVGINGAGKSTIIKLLLRFYEPDSGSILINGIDIMKYDINAYRKLFSACFQNVTRYSLTLAENVALSEIHRINETERICTSLENSGLGDANELISQEGIKTPLTRSFEANGIELSEGQWQKVSIARAFFRNAPFIILDEPSSSLDPKAEDQIFTSFSKLCGDKSGILISHRLSSIIMVDKIIFLDGGIITEYGTHEDLIKQNGKYAEMYRLQAKKYRGFSLEGADK